MFHNCFSGIVHENLRIGSDGESEEVSGASDEKDDMISPVKMRQRSRHYSEVSEINLYHYMGHIALKMIHYKLK